jgi:hypothetical protein
MARLRPALADLIKSLRGIVDRQVRVLNEVLAVLVNHETAKQLRDEQEPIEDDVAGALFPILQAVGSSTHTVITLSKNVGLQTRDCITIARTIVEGGINACYIIAEGEPAARQASKHARQKSFLDLQRESRVGGEVIRLACSKRPEPDKIAGLQDDIDEFTSRAGREKGWTDLGVDDRLKVIGSKLDGTVMTLLHGARFAIYRHSSEIIHGTLFGALFFLGRTSGSSAKSPDNAMEHIGQQHMLVLFSILCTIAAVVEAMHRRYGFAKSHEKALVLWDEVKKLSYFAQEQGREH